MSTIQNHNPSEFEQALNFAGVHPLQAAQIAEKIEANYIMVPKSCAAAKMLIMENGGLSVDIRKAEEWLRQRCGDLERENARLRDQILNIQTPVTR